MRRLMLLASAAALLLSGCAAPDTRSYENAVKRGVPPTNQSYDENYSRAANIARVFALGILDADPERVNAVRVSLVNAVHRIDSSFAEAGGRAWGDSLINNIAVGLLYAPVSKVPRHQLDQWWVTVPFFDATGDADALKQALKRAGEMSAAGLSKAGFTTELIGEFTAPDGSHSVSTSVSYRLINPERGCVKPEKDGEPGCVMTLTDVHAYLNNRDTLPEWMLPNGGLRYVHRNITVSALGHTESGASFSFTHEERLALAKGAENGSYFYGAASGDSANFVSEDGKIHYAHMTPKMLEAFRNRPGMFEKFANDVGGFFSKLQ